GRLVLHARRLQVRAARVAEPRPGRLAELVGPVEPVAGVGPVVVARLALAQLEPDTSGAATGRRGRGRWRWRGWRDGRRRRTNGGGGCGPRRRRRGRGGGGRDRFGPGRGR